MASPFVGKKFTFTQPDGTKFEVRGWGDQHYARFETLDGYSVVKNPSTGFFEIAQVSSDGTMLESAPGPPGNLDGSLAPVEPGVRISREAARARGMEGALQMGGRRCDERREQRKNLIRAAHMLGGRIGSSSGSKSSPILSGSMALRTIKEFNSPIGGINSFPRHEMPMALICVSRNGSSSSTMIRSSTFPANSRIFFSGSGQTIPSFSTAASGKASLT